MLNDLRKKALKIYESKEVFRSHLLSENKFPLEISLLNISSSDLREDFLTYREQIELLTRECQSFGLALQFKEVNNRVLGRQSVPDKVTFPALEAFLGFLSKVEEFETFKKNSNVIPIRDFPKLKDFLVKYPDRVFEFDGVWEKILVVSNYLLANPSLKFYIRQLEIAEIDTKFIESHKRIIWDVMVALSPEERPRIELVDFEENCGLRKEDARLRFRILDDEVKPLFFGLEDIEASVADLAQKEIPCDTVIIVENKVTGLCIPPHEKSIVFFELGYKAALLKKIPWISKKRIIYWGDIDTYGFSILSSLREFFPDVESRLMDVETLFRHQSLWSLESSSFKGNCANLTSEEQELFTSLQTNRFGHGVRLEQERIRISEFKI